MVEGREVEGCPNDGFVLWHDPKVATAVVVEVTEGGLVLGRRGIEPGYGLWCLPGGFVNDDEDPADAAIRECREEIGVEVVLTGLLGVYHVPKSDAPSMIGIAYRGRVADGEVPAAGSEMLEVAVFASEALPELAFPSHRSVISEYLTSRGREVEAGSLRGGAAARRGAPPSQAPGRPRSRRTP